LGNIALPPRQAGRSRVGAQFLRQQKGRPQAALDTLYRDWLWFLIFEENREGTPNAA
jgi:hypothetical protein